MEIWIETAVWCGGGEDEGIDYFSLANGTVRAIDYVFGDGDYDEVEALLAVVVQERLSVSGCGPYGSRQC